MRLRYAAELVVAFAAGLALIRATLDLPLFVDELAPFPLPIRNAYCVTVLGGPFCTGLVLVEGTALWIEAVRRRTPRIWGFGRLTWSVCFCAAILTLLHSVVWIVAREALWPDDPPDGGPILQQWGEWLIGSVGELVVKSGAPLCLAGVLISSLASRWPRDPAPDAREWAGRIFFGALIVIYLTDQTFFWYFRFE